MGLGPGTILYSVRVIKSLLLLSEINLVSICQTGRRIVGTFK